MTTGTTLKATGLTYLQVQENLERLKLTQAHAALDGLAEQAAHGQWSYIEFLGKLLEEEMAARQERRLAVKQRLAPVAETLLTPEIRYSKPGLADQITYLRGIAA